MKIKRIINEEEIPFEDDDVIDESVVDEDGFTDGSIGISKFIDESKDD